MTRPQGWLALILALAIGSLLVLRSLPLSLGLDLRGGSQLTLLVKPAGDITRVESKQLEAVKEVLDLALACGDMSEKERAAYDDELLTTDVSIAFGLGD